MPAQVKRFIRKRRSAVQRNVKGTGLRGMPAPSPGVEIVGGAIGDQRVATAGWAWAHFEAVGWDEV